MMPVPRFEDALEVTPLDDGRNWCVEHPFYYDTDVPLTPTWTSTLTYLYVNQRPDGTHRITVPCGFVTDFASTPRFMWRLIPPTGRYTRAAVIHDLLYRTKGLATRAQADAVLYEAMKFPCGVGFVTRWAVYLGVRVGGASSYRGGL